MQTFTVANGRKQLTAILLAIAVCAAAFQTRAEEPSTAAEEAAAFLGITGGLCVKIGAKDTDMVEQLAKSGRFLVQVLDADKRVVDEARRRLHAKKLYGMVTVECLPQHGTLPYAENLVNLLIVSSQDTTNVSAEQVNRVLCPNGVLVIGSDKATTEELEVQDLQTCRSVGGSGRLSLPASRGRRRWTIGPIPATRPTATPSRATHW